MKRAILVLMFISSLSLFGDCIISIGGPYFGGGVFGVETEFLITENIGLSIGGSYLGFNSGIFYHLEDNVKSSYIYSSYNISLDNGIDNQSVILAVGTRDIGIFDFRVGLEYNTILSEERKNMYKEIPILKDILPLSFVMSIAIVL